jgi:excinuclease UvrABC nuclease subunit
MMNGARLQWRAQRYGVALDHAVPERSGVYTISRVTRFGGLPLSIKHLYVGRTISLRRRWRDHVHYLEANPGLHGLHRQPEIEFWWAAAPVGELMSIERQLIERLQPELNRLGVNRQDRGAP